MVIHKVKSREQNCYQHYEMVWDCIYYWRRLTNADFPNYFDVMNMKTCRYNMEHNYYIALTYHFNPNKW